MILWAMNIMSFSNRNQLLQNLNNHIFYFQIIFIPHAIRVLSYVASRGPFYIDGVQNIISINEQNLINAEL